MARTSFIVSYDLLGRDGKPERYAELIAAIKDYGYWGKLTLSTWIVVSDGTAEAIRDELNQHLEAEDRIFVAPLGKPAAWRNVIASNDWLMGRP